MIQQQHWVLKCNLLILLSPQHTMFTLHVNDAFISKQGRLCWRSLPFLCYRCQRLMTLTFTRRNTVEQRNALLLGQI